MKKSFTFLLSALMLTAISLTACNSKKAEAPAASAAPVAAPAAASAPAPAAQAAESASDDVAHCADGSVCPVE